MSLINHTQRQSGFAEIIVVIAIVIVILIALGLGYISLAKNKGMWPFTQASNSSVATSTTEPSIEITKIAVESETLQIALKLTNTNDTGHCVLTLSSQATYTQIDDSKIERDAEAQAMHKTCEGWGIGVKDFPAGEYTVKVDFVGSEQKLTTTKKITLE